MGNISQLNELTTPATGDFLLVRDISDATDKDKKLALSKIGVLSLAQTWSAAQTFSAGISLGNETLSVYDVGSWTPAITGSTTNPTVTYSVQNGDYVRIGSIIFYAFRIVISTISGGSGSLRVSLPATANSVLTCGAAFTQGANYPTGTVSVTFNPSTSSAFGVYNAIVDDASTTILAVGDVTNGDELRASGVYLV